jgi:hypothetical protein
LSIWYSPCTGSRYKQKPQQQHEHVKTDVAIISKMTNCLDAHRLPGCTRHIDAAG